MMALLVFPTMTQNMQTRGAFVHIFPALQHRGRNELVKRKDVFKLDIQTAN